MNVPLLDLKAQYRALKPELDEAVLRVAESQYFILGPEVERLEKSIAEYTGTKYAIGVSSGTDALLLALMALNIGPGDGVIVPTFSFFATAGVVSRLGATPIFIDVDPVTFNISPAALEEAIIKYASLTTLKIKAVVPVHLYGQSADMKALMEVASRYDLTVVEDCAQAIGTTYSDGEFVGSIGHVGCFSFFPSKNLGGYGDGGIITTNDETLAHRIHIMRVHGGEPKYYHKVIGGNFRLDALQAAVLNVKLPYLANWSHQRRENAQRYNAFFLKSGVAAFSDSALSETVKVLLPKPVYEDAAALGTEPVANGYTHIFNQYCIQVENRDGLIDHLRSQSIGCEIYYPVPFHKQECFADVPSGADAFPVSDRVCAHILALPIYPELTEAMQAYVANAVLDFLSK